jgi:hypothetical protein
MLGTGQTRRETMARTTAACSIALAALLAASAAYAEDSSPLKAPLAQYLMPADAEIALARSAAPPALSADATILVLTTHGYDVAAKGTNGFTCLVERGWQAPFDQTDFGTTKIHGAVCYNAPAVRTVLPYTYERTKLVLAGMTVAQMHVQIAKDIADKVLVPPEIGAMSYMMSKDQDLGSGHWHPHLMFHVPPSDAAAWGANLDGSPVVFDPDHHDVPEPQTIYMITVGHWSDGTEYQHPHM